MKKLLAWILAVLLCLTGCAAPENVTITEASAPTAAPETEFSTVPGTNPVETEPAETEQAATDAPVVVLPEPEDADLVRVLDYIPQIRQALAYATVNNFAGQRIYDFTDAYLRYGTVKKLAKVCEELAEQGIGLKIWDGFRPVAAQAKLWEICPDATFVSHPVTGNRAHCRGSAVDVTLVDLETGEELPVPTGFDNFTAYADRDYSDCSPEAAENARLLEQTMEKYGFKPYYAEWWHFSDTDEYPVDEYFDPAVPTLWAANCEEYISLRSSAGGAEILARIPAGAVMELKDWDGKYACVTYGALRGYVMTSYIMPADDSYFSECLDTVTPTNVYSYEQMLADMEALQAAAPDTVSTAVIGTSEMGREIPVLRIGSLEARYHVLLQGSIHGREHLTAWLLMALADYWLDHGILGYGDVCYHIIPMTNPDGVVISQTGTLNDAQREIYLSDKENGYTSKSESSYATLWKANAEGVDINRNFPAGWAQIDDRTGPSSQQYQGSEPFSAAEAAALRDYTLKYAFDATISFHATGSLIYYAYGDKEPVNTQSKALAKAVREISGYDLASSNGVDGAGYKDWAIDSLQIPSLTVEVGCQDAALAERETFSIFVRNYRVLPAIARWLQMQ